MRLPKTVKRALVAVWNGGHRGSWFVQEWLGAIAHGRRERCTCCGRFGWMLLRRRAVPGRLIELWQLDRAETRALRRKETLLCSRCGAPLRSRRLARVILALYPVEGARSLREWVNGPRRPALAIAEINRIPGVHERLAGMPGFVSSEFRDAAAPSSQEDTRPHEDLLALSYADESFDLVLTSETLEHVPDLGRALSEIHRVLKPGGIHLFTVPLWPRVQQTYRRRTGQDVATGDRSTAPIAHPGGDWGYPVFTEFGLDLPEILERAGFGVECWFGPVSREDVAQVWVARKREPAAPIER